MTRVTNHAARRTKERLGLPKKLSHKNAENALRYGIRHSDTSGSLNRYISALYWKHETANNVRIYCNNVYIQDVTKFLNAGCLYFHKSCKSTFEEFETYSWDEEKAEDAVIKENDHSMDQLRYFCRTALRNELKWIV